ncbi:hypothetical protein L6452_19138 [Arctium lappa]|uniref:Uncharacterized protein n=1 Tax=Arctium lappa TaxID=4217 RepID=A0ACB9B720_ARCLA|nr:hypothetical protein L6452_19138 [Arctium lappa]
MIDFNTDDEEIAPTVDNNCNEHPPIVDNEQIIVNPESNDVQQTHNEGVETLMKDLTMEDRENDVAEGKGKAAEENKKKDKPLKAYSRKNKRNTGDSDFKSVPIIDIGSSSRYTRSTTRVGLQKANELNESTPKKDGMDVKDKRSESKTTIKTEGICLLMKHLMNAKGEAEKWLESVTTAFPDDHTFDKYKNNLDNLFNTSRWTSSHGQDESTIEDKGVHNSMAIVVYKDRYTTDELDACWESPTFVVEVCESAETEVQKSEGKKSSSK